MEKTMFKDLEHNDRIDNFQANADGVEEKTYFVELNTDELIKKRSEFSGKSIEVARIEDQKKDAMEGFKALLKPLKIETSNLLTEIKTGHIEKEGGVFKMIDRDEGMVGFYSEEGDLIESRPATQEERTQLTIHGGSGRKTDPLIVK